MCSKQRPPSCAMADGAPRKRKWDVPAPGGAAAPPPTLPPQAFPPAAFPAEAIASAQAAAAAAIAARLGAGALAARPGAPLAFAPLAAEEDASQELELNDAEPAARGALTKRGLQEEVTRKTGCIVHTRRALVPLWLPSRVQP
jgi:hypothetical protein